MHTYRLNGNQIVAEEWTTTDVNGVAVSHVLVYLYDAEGTPVGMQYRNQTYAAEVFDVYWYEKNLQGDVVAVYGNDGTPLIFYHYDAWGNIKTEHSDNWSASSTANLNPFLYRGYYYDSELEMYYLQSRYYDPVIGRFLTADKLSTLNASPFSTTDKNLFAYCDNNPVMRKDDGGMFWETVFDIVSLAVSVVEVVQNPKDPLAWAGVIGDAIDLIPFVSGVGEVTRAVTTGMKVADTIDDVHDASKVADNIFEAGKTVIEKFPEQKLPNQIKLNDVTDAWDEFLGPNQTSINRFTGQYDPNRIFSADGTRSVRFGNHEMDSLGTTKAHFHYELWDYDSLSNTVYVSNFLQRLKRR